MTGLVEGLQADQVQRGQQLGSEPRDVPGPLPVNEQTGALWSRETQPGLSE